MEQQDVVVAMRTVDIKSTRCSFSTVKSKCATRLKFDPLTART